MKRPTYFKSFIFLLITCIAATITAQPAAPDLPCGTLHLNFDENTTYYDYRIPSDMIRVRLTLKGGAGGNTSLGVGIPFTNAYTPVHLRKGGAGATVQVTFEADHSLDLNSGGTLRFIVGEAGEGEHRYLTNNAQGAGGGSSGVAYLPPGQDPNGPNWHALAVAGGGGGSILAVAHLDGLGGNAYHVLRGDALSSSTIIDGFTITAGQADGGSVDINRGGGMYNTNASNPTIRNCHFFGNFALYGAGITNSHSAPMIENCLFTGNRSGR